MIDYSQIESYSKCDCGAITLYFTNGANNSMSNKTRKQLGIDLRNIRKAHTSYCCNHCVNHWGIDLCECGSGEEVGKCECGSDKAVETFGEKYDSFSKILKNFC
jgi:hypothetical protein